MRRLPYRIQAALVSLGGTQEHIFKFLQNGLKGERTLEVALSSTLVFMGFWLEEPVKKPVKFGTHCEANHPEQFVAYCLSQVPNERKHGASLTATGFNDTTLFSFETPHTIEAKMRRFVMPLDDKVFRRVGWAFFDLAYEVYNRSACIVNNTVSQIFPRLTAGKAVLDENRNRKFA
ncbi:hypothetical protein V5799_027492 [Amblyomma americanum]|uniref:Uncharacterized protein n=1 Tax=Amblyomma americanum TaxID=6943 RepID=A0AAQ4DFK2_AMBAM